MSSFVSIGPHRAHFGIYKRCYKDGCKCMIDDERRHGPYTYLWLHHMGPQLYFGPTGRDTARRLRKLLDAMAAGAALCAACRPDWLAADLKTTPGACAVCRQGAILLYVPTVPDIPSKGGSKAARRHVDQLALVICWMLALALTVAACGSENGPLLLVASETEVAALPLADADFVCAVEADSHNLPAMRAFGQGVTLSGGPIVNLDGDQLAADIDELWELGPAAVVWDFGHAVVPRTWGAFDGCPRSTLQPTDPQWSGPPVGCDRVLPVLCIEAR